MQEPSALCNTIVIVATCLCSFFGFRHQAVEDQYIFHPESILARKEYYRLVTSAFLHAGWGHLFWNMFSLYLFGNTVELVFGKAEFLSIYFGSVVGGNLLSLYVHRHHDYLAYGASGGVCGVIFAYILLFPGAGVHPLFLPISIPGWLYSIAFLVGSFLALQKGRDNVGHDAHLGGAIVGLLIAAALHPEAVQYNWKVFLIVFAAAAALLVYLWVNPLLLPSAGLAFPFFRRRTAKPEPTGGRREELEVDIILEKVAKSGVQSLSRKENALLKRVSRTYRNRADSKPPDSGLTI